MLNIHKKDILFPQHSKSIPILLMTIFIHNSFILSSTEAIETTTDNPQCKTTLQIQQSTEKPILFPNPKTNVNLHPTFAKAAHFYNQYNAIQQKLETLISSKTSKKGKSLRQLRKERIEALELAGEQLSEAITRNLHMTNDEMIHDKNLQLTNGENLFLAVGKEYAASRLLDLRNLLSKNLKNSKKQHHYLKQTLQFLNRGLAETENDNTLSERAQAILNIIQSNSKSNHDDLPLILGIEYLKLYDPNDSILSVNYLYLAFWFLNEAQMRNHKVAIEAQKIYDQMQNKQPIHIMKIIEQNNENQLTESMLKPFSSSMNLNIVYREILKFLFYERVDPIHVANGVIVKGQNTYFASKAILAFLNKKVDLSAVVQVTRDIFIPVKDVSEIEGLVYNDETISHSNPYGNMSHYGTTPNIPLWGKVSFYSEQLD